MQLQRGESNIDPYAEKPSTGSRTLSNVRCEGCSRLLAELVTTPYKLFCVKCKMYAEK